MAAFNATHFFESRLRIPHLTAACTSSPLLPPPLSLAVTPHALYSLFAIPALCPPMTLSLLPHTHPFLPTPRHAPPPPSLSLSVSPAPTHPSSLHLVPLLPAMLPLAHLAVGTAVYPSLTDYAMWMEDIVLTMYACAQPAKEPSTHASAVQCACDRKHTLCMCMLGDVLGCTLHPMQWACIILFLCVRQSGCLFAA